MKFSFAIILVFALSSFAPSAGLDDDNNAKAIFSATVDGKAFKLREDQLLRGLLTSKAASMDGKTEARTVISASFEGPTYDLADGRTFTENVQFEIAFEPETLGPSSQYAVALKYKSSNYYMVKDESKLSISGFEWESDKKHFRLSAEYDCKLRSWGYPADGKPDVDVKGRLSNIRITVPSWLVVKN